MANTSSKSSNYAFSLSVFIFFTFLIFSFCSFFPSFALKVNEKEGGEKRDSEEEDSVHTSAEFSAGAKVERMTPEEIKERMGLLFPLIDSDSNGKLTKDELSAWAEKVKHENNIRQASIELSSIDKDKDGQASFEEITAAQSESQGPTDAKTMEGLQKRFNAVDKNGDGLLDKHELSLLIHPGNNTELLGLEVEYVLEHQDKDGDGKLNYDEFAFRESPDEPFPAEDDAMKHEFKSFDKNGDGFISKEEIAEAIASTGMEEMMSSIDKILGTTEDGAILRDKWVNEYEKYVKSAATDGAELLRSPEEYNLSIPFKNSAKIVVDREEDEEPLLNEEEGHIAGHEEL